MKPSDVQTLVLRNPRGPAVAHLILRVPRRPACFEGAIELLRTLDASFGPQREPRCVSIGFTFAGLERLGMPDAYLRLLNSLAPAFADGAVLRSSRLGDHGPSAAPHWEDGFQHERSHVLVTWHGDPAFVDQTACAYAKAWRHALRKPDATEVAVSIKGQRLGAPPQEEGEWVHYGYRDGLSEILIDQEQPPPDAEDLRRHAPGELLLSEINDAGFNSFGLSLAPDKVHDFFRDSSFGILRKMDQDVKRFGDWIKSQADLLSQATGRSIQPAFVKAKLCGRWPTGHQMMPGDIDAPTGTLVLELGRDALGEGCPFGSHIRRMRAPPEPTPNPDPDDYRAAKIFDRPLQRRSVPYGRAEWDAPHDVAPRGLLGHFFCSSIENQFEHLLGQWAARAPVGFAAEDRAPDPVIGQPADDNAAMLMPWQGLRTQRLKGVQAWTTTRGTMYAWYPGRSGLDALLASDFVPDDPGGPWL